MEHLIFNHLPELFIYTITLHVAKKIVAISFYIFELSLFSFFYTQLHLGYSRKKVYALHFHFKQGDIMR